MNKSLLCFILLLIFTSSQAQENRQVYKPAYPSMAENSKYYILTPPAKAQPQINGASVFGVRPGSPFIYTIPATGSRPMEFSVKHLPEGLTVDSQTGRISGKIKDTTEKDYTVKLMAKNEKGKDTKEFTIKVGQTICLTPPLGWNSFNCWARRDVTQERVLESARAMVDKGLINYGFSYMNIDVGWPNSRGGKFNAIQPNEKFPDIKAMFDEIHALGLKGGIYSSPWITTYGAGAGGSSDNKDGHWEKSMIDPRYTKLKDTQWRRVGKYKFHSNDVKQWVDWGVDYLKYDWSPIDSVSLVLMADELESCGRDIVYSISNNTKFNMANLVKTRVNCFRSGGDLKDRWDTDGKAWNMLQAWEMQNKWLEVYRGEPGHFLDPDMMVVGKQMMQSKELVPSRLTADEQYTHITLWTLWASPMLMGCPVDQMDDFTFNLFSNSEVLDIHQDATAVGGIPVFQKDGIEIVVKDLENGEKAIGLFNKNATEQVVTMDWETVGLEGKKKLRDVWRNKDIGTFKDSFSASVRSHGTILIRVK
ncbi:putative Ig domain-containing protein [uncultured Draconibacterium sp.]|uniref:putative Ig domain-containing protein n=1 Tax=uncultured Draconibacterium sp. TaxID=1573823 RepID=UPI0029C05DAC|nr:putative Ig domain-containing protein [uncultured Draconibacterium sp.]